MANSAPRLLKLYFDGGCRPNPGPIETAVVARGRTYLRSAAGFGSNDAAEWMAALQALEVARQLGGDDLILIGDSALVINQGSGRAPCRSAALRPWFDAFHERAGAFERVRLRQVRRNQNLAGIALEQARRAV